jgi:hypothetical protein
VRSFGRFLTYDGCRHPVWLGLRLLQAQFGYFFVKVEMTNFLMMPVDISSFQ